MNKISMIFLFLIITSVPLMAIDKDEFFEKIVSIIIIDCYKLNDNENILFEDTMENEHFWRGICKIENGTELIIIIDNDHLNIFSICNSDIKILFKGTQYPLWDHSLADKRWIYEYLLYRNR